MTSIGLTSSQKLKTQAWKLNGPIKVVGTLTDFSKQLGERFDSAEELAQAVSKSSDALEALMIDEWSVGEITVKPIDRVPDDVSFVL